MMSFSKKKPLLHNPPFFESPPLTGSINSEFPLLISASSSKNSSLSKSSNSSNGETLAGAEGKRTTREQQQSRKQPLMTSSAVSLGQRRIHISDARLEDEQQILKSRPTGDWTSHYVEEALRRQVSKELQLKSIFTNTVSLLGAYGLICACETLALWYCVGTSGISVNHAKDSLLMASHELVSIAAQICGYLRYLPCCLAVLLVIEIFRFLSPQDQCLDLPLSADQRERLGLNPVEEINAEKWNQVMPHERNFDVDRITGDAFSIPTHDHVNQLMN